MQYNRILEGTMAVANHSKNSTMEAENQVKHGASSKSLMSRVNFFRKACFALLLAGIFFGGCDLENFVAPGGNDGLKQLNVTIADNEYNDLIDTVKLMLDSREVIATAAYNNGNITFSLPDNVPTGYLVGIREWWYGLEGVTVNNPNVLMAMPDIVAFKNGTQVAYIDYYNDDDDAWGDLVYFSNDIVINGKYTDTWDRNITNVHEEIEDYSINAKRGWNMLYGTRSYDEDDIETGIKSVRTYKTTTTAPTGLKWIVDFDLDWGYDPITAGADLTITAEIENASSLGNVNRVRADSYNRAVAAGLFDDGGFTLVLPKKAYPWTTVADWLWWYSGSGAIDISDENARLEIIEDIAGYSSSAGQWSGHLVDFIHGNSETIVRYIFSSADVDVTRSGSTVNYEMELKAGWNTVYEIQASNGNITVTTEPVEDLKWYREQDFPGSLSVSRATKSLNNRRIKSRMFGR